MSTLNLATLATIQYADLSIDELRTLKEELLEKILQLANIKRRVADDMAEDMIEEQMGEYMRYVTRVNEYLQKFYVQKN